MENKYTVDYDKKIVTLHFDGEIFNFNLNEGDVGDFWHSFTTKAGIIKDVNFYQEDAGEVPNFSVYGVKKSKGGFLIDTSDEIYISNFEQVGNPVNYFGEDGEEISEARWFGPLDDLQDTYPEISISGMLVNAHLQRKK